MWAGLQLPSAGMGSQVPRHTEAVGNQGAPLSAPPSILRGSWVQRVAEAVAEEVEGEEGER